MTLELRYRVVSVNADGYSATSRFTSARSTYQWVSQLISDGIKWSAHKTTNGKESSLTLAAIQKDAGVLPTKKRKR